MVKTAIVLAAGKGTRLKPLFIDDAKTLLKIDNETILEKNIRNLCESGIEKIIIVTGHKADKIEKFIYGDNTLLGLEGKLYDKDIKVSIELVYCPFYNMTNNIVSLWMAKEYLVGDTVVIYGDILYNVQIMKNLLQKKGTTVCMDSMFGGSNDYSVKTCKGSVIGMGKELEGINGEYIGITKLAKEDLSVFKQEMDYIIRNQEFNMWYEDILIQLIYSKSFKLNYYDVAGQYFWSEIDNLNDLILTRQMEEFSNE